MCATAIEGFKQLYWTANVDATLAYHEYNKYFKSAKEIRPRKNSTKHIRSYSARILSPMLSNGTAI